MCCRLVVWLRLYCPVMKVNNGFMWYSGVLFKEVGSLHEFFLRELCRTAKSRTIWSPHNHFGVLLWNKLYTTLVHLMFTCLLCVLIVFISNSHITPAGLVNRKPRQDPLYGISNSDPRSRRNTGRATVDFLYICVLQER